MKKCLEPIFSASWKTPTLCETLRGVPDRLREWAQVELDTIADLAFDGERLSEARRSHQDTLGALILSKINYNKILFDANYLKLSSLQPFKVLTALPIDGSLLGCSRDPGRTKLNRQELPPSLESLFVLFGICVEETVQNVLDTVTL